MPLNGILGDDDPVGAIAAPLRVVRLLVFAPAFAVLEWRAIDQVVARINTQFLGRVRLEVATGGAGIPDPIACDMVLVLLRPRQDGDSDPSAKPAPGTTVSLSAAVDRPAGVAPPDLFIFGHASVAADDDDGWETRKQRFRTWFESKGGDYLVLDRYASAAELSTKVETQFNMWLTHAGFAPPSDASDVVAAPDAPPSANLTPAETPIPAVQPGTEAVSPGTSQPSLPEVLADALGLVAGLEPVSEVAIVEKPRTARYRAPRRGVAAKASVSDNRV